MSKLVAERGGLDLLPQLGYQPVNKYLPPRPRRTGEVQPAATPAPSETLDTAALSPLLRWVDRVLSR
ncbi:hypothetical protein D3C76_1793690 [compost metagenome]